MSVKRCDIEVCHDGDGTFEVWAEQGVFNNIALAQGRTRKEALRKAHRRLSAMKTEVWRIMKKESRR